jgi:hypothetical protein
MDGVLIRVIHTGKTASDLVVEGAFIDAELRPYGMVSEEQRMKQDRLTRIVALTSLSVVLGSLLILAAVELIWSRPHPIAPGLLGSLLWAPVLMVLGRFRFRPKILRKLNLDW